MGLLARVVENRSGMRKPAESEISWADDEQAARHEERQHDDR